MGSQGEDSNQQKKVLDDVFNYIGIDEVDDKLFSKVFSSASPTFRKGAIGKWKESFDSEISEVFRELSGEYLIKYGYEINDDWVKNIEN